MIFDCKMISKIINCKADQNSLKNKEETNTGLRIPGANWQKFKNLVKEENTNEQSSDNIPIKRKRKRKRKPSQKASTNLTNMTPQSSEVKQQTTTEANVKKEAKKKSEQETGLTRIIAMDCEMVGIGDGKDSMPARISIVNQHEVCVYDKYVKPTEEITDYRTAVSGIRPHHLQNGEDFKEENTNEQSSDNIPIKRKKKRKRKPSQKASTNLTNMTPQSSEVKQQTTTEANVKKEAKKKSEQETGLTRIIAMDCEMVGIGDGKDSMLARISIVNQHGVCVYDKYVKPTEEITDYRTAVSGIRPHHLQNGEYFKTVQKEVSEILKGRILVGHALHNDLAVLFLSHPKRFQRDTARYKPFRTVTKGSIPSLKKLASELLGVDIQSGEHNSIEDARTAMQIYLLFRKKWENEIRNR